ncbi:MAG: hypothetical protein Ct9H90mP2_15080 [Dehalococcoidia bacterium]|nr:MAG: hypothetical protein Ct9H90mP2_15080 [Dehalococcoidia bacterium]
MAEHVVGSMVGLAHSFSKLFKDQNNRKWDVEQWNSKIVEFKGVQMYAFTVMENLESLSPKTESI